MIISPFPSGTAAHIFSSRTAPSNVTTDDSQVSWVSAGDGRSTSDILWSCFSILLVCTWKCIHFNVPSIHESEARWRRWGILCWPGTRLWLNWAYQVRWMIGIILVPELGVAIAMHQYLGAREGLEKLRVDKPKKIESKETKSKGDRMNVLGVGRDEITKSHIFLANMGGFVVNICVLSRPQQGGPLSDEGDETSSIPKTSLELIYTIRNYKDLEILLNRFPELRLPSEKDIEDLSKADSFTKAFACVQSSWLVVQSIARVSQGLPITQLELATMAFVVCALMMYMLWWDKPFGVDRRIVLTVITYEWKHDMVLLPARSSNHIPNLEFDDFGQIYLGALDFDPHTLKEVLYAFGAMIGHVFGRLNSINPPQRETRSITFYVTATLFSAFHIGAWNWEFPSPIVRTLWRTFALAATGTGPASIFLNSFCAIIEDKLPRDFFNLTLATISILLMLTYVISRLALMVLIFYCFSSMPARVYETVDWAKFLPHFA